MTGRMPSVHDVRSNGIPLSMDAVTFVDLLRDAGYRTALIGKSHLQNFTPYDPIIKRPPPREGFHEPSPELRRRCAIISADPKYEQETPAILDHAGARMCRRRSTASIMSRWCARTATRPGGDYDRWLDARDPKAKNLLGPKNSLPHDYTVPQAYRTAIPEELYATSFLGERACAYLDEAQGDEPFFLMVSFPDPHHPFNPPGKYWDMYKPEQFAGAGGVHAQRLDAAGAGAEHHQGARGRQGQPHRHGHHRRVGARGAGGEGADLRHDRLRRRRHRLRCSRALDAAASATTRW